MAPAFEILFKVADCMTDSFSPKLTNSELHLFFNRSIACLSKRGDSFELHIMTITIYSRTKPKLNLSPSSIESINFFPRTPIESQPE